jgi:hypothetical protein
MKRSTRRFSDSRPSVALGAAATVALAADLPKVRVLATGGTIAGAQASATDYGYKSGAYDVNSLISAVPNLDKLAVITGEQVANIGSQDMNDEVWLTLAKRVNAVLAEPGTDGVADHPRHGHAGGDELLPHAGHQAAPSRSSWWARCGPATAISADGPGNIYNGVAVVTNPEREGQGHARRAQRRDPLCPQCREDEHDHGADLRQHQPRPGRRGEHRQDPVVRAHGQESRSGHGILDRRARQAAARGRDLRARQHERGPDRRGDQERG